MCTLTSQCIIKNCIGAERVGTRQREKEREGMKGERERVVAHARPALCTITAGEQTVDALVVRLSGGAVPAPCRSPRAHPPTACVFWSQLRTARLATSAKRGVLLASAVRAACARSSVLFCVQPCFACPMHVHTYFTQCISRNCIGAERVGTRQRERERGGREWLLMRGS